MTSRFRLRDAARSLYAGGVIAYPTEAVYGLGCLPRVESAVRKLLQLKQRQPEKGLILIAADFSQLENFVIPLEDDAMSPILSAWPGPHTWLLPAQPWVPDWVRGKHKTLAVRVTDHPIASALCRTANSPLVSTSANLSSRPPARSAFTVRQQFGDSIDCIVSGPLGNLKNPTPIRDAASGKTLRM